MNEAAILAIFFGGVLSGFSIAALLLAPDTPFWRGFRDGWALRFWTRK